LANLLIYWDTGTNAFVDLQTESISDGTLTYATTDVQEVETKANLYSYGNVGGSL